MMQSSVLEMVGTWFFNFLLDLLIKLWLLLLFLPRLYVAGSIPHPPVFISSIFKPLLFFLLSISVGDPAKDDLGDTFPFPIIELYEQSFVGLLWHNAKLNILDIGECGLCFWSEFWPETSLELSLVSYNENDKLRYILYKSPYSPIRMNASLNYLCYIIFKICANELFVTFAVWNFQRLKFLVIRCQNVIV